MALLFTFNWRESILSKYYQNTFTLPATGNNCSFSKRNKNCFALLYTKQCFYQDGHLDPPNNLWAFV